MRDDIVGAGRQALTETKVMSREMTEKALRMRCMAYQTQLKADLLTQTIFSMKVSKTALVREIEERIRTESELARERNFVSAVLDTAGAYIIVFDDRERVVRFNRACERSTGYSYDTIRGRVVWGHFFPEEDIVRIKETFRRIRMGEFPVEAETGWKSLNQGMRTVHWSVTALSSFAGKVEYVIATGIDVTDQKRAQERLKLTHAVFENAIEGIMISDAAGVIQSVNPAFSLVTGYAADEVIGKSPSVLQSGRHTREFYADMWSGLLRDGRWQGEIWNKRKNGEVYPEWLSLTAVRDERDRVTHFVGVFDDIAERKKREELIKHLAYHDPLTGLPNRQLFNERLDLELAHAERSHTRLGVLFIDLDRFKVINDTYGHNVGDKVLSEIGRRLKEGLRASDSVARMGGDEFVILLPDVGENEVVAQVAGKIVERLGAPIVIDGVAYLATPSVGVAIYPEHGEEPLELLRNADMAMYDAKAAGRNNFKIRGR
jgi:diguanylate cyclase (GGDEF)-like protein/PAS domain S-box-containing protein